MLKKQLTVDIIICLIIIIFLEFFSLTLLDDSIKFLVLFATGILLMVNYFIALLIHKPIRKHPLDNLVLLFIFSMILSSFMAYIYWDQSFFSSLKDYRSFYIYFLYFFLVYLNVSSERIERIIILLFFLSLLIFLIDFITFPNPLFSWRDEERRNGITMFFFGQGFTFLGAFYYLERFFYKKNIFHLIWFVLSFGCLFMLTQSRMNLLALGLGFFFILISSNLKRRYLSAILLFIVAGIFFSSSNLFNGIKEATKDEAHFYKKDTRLLAQNYFLTELQGGVPTVLLGNGVPSEKSRLGLESINGEFYTSDVGLTGVFSYFGILGVIIWILFFYSVFKVKNIQNSVYLKAYFITLLTTAFTGFSIFDPGYMPATILCLYLVRSKTSIDDSVKSLDD